MRKFKKDSEVIIISGSDKGKKGKILKVLPNEKKVIVEKINIIKKHNKPLKDRSGGIEAKESPLPWSKIKMICPSTGKLSRIGFIIKNKKKYRVLKKSQYIFEA